MKYLMVSDIHGCLPALEQVLRFYRSEACDLLCVLGDILNYGPRNRIPEGIDPQGIARCLNDMSDEVIAIRGNCDSEVDQMLLHFPIMADYALVVDEGKKLFLTHGHIYNKERQAPGHFDALFYGHTHLWELARQEELAVCNTGSITFPKGGNVPTFATYEAGEITVHRLDGQVMKRMQIG